MRTTKEKGKKIFDFDIVVIGAGPAGLMAAIQAASSGCQVAVLEKNSRPGKKLLLSGGGRCNLLHAVSSYRELASFYGSAKNFLLPVFSRFGYQEAADFFRGLDLEMREEKEGQIFPANSSSFSVLERLLNKASDLGVAFFYGNPVVSLETSETSIVAAKTVSGNLFKGKIFIVATGGLSYPETGSTGDACHWLEPLGQPLEKFSPGLCPLELADKKFQSLAGISWPEAALSFPGKKKFYGSLMFTPSGLSGPLAIDFSRELRGKKFPLMLKLDFFPFLTEKDLLEELETASQQNKSLLKNFLRSWLPERLVLFFIAAASLEPSRPVSSIYKREWGFLVSLLKDWDLPISGLSGYRRAMVTLGGFSLNQVDSKTMRSRLIDNLYLAGEVLDIDGPCGGFNLQACWSTGYLAGQAAAAQKEEKGMVRRIK